VRFGAAYWIQRTDWPALRDACLAAERAGFDSLWLDDHLLADEGDWQDGKLEGWASLGALAPLTTTARLGLLVAANTFRNPGLTAKLATTLDHLSGGRFILGIGGGWFEREHEAFGLDFGSGFGERLDRLEEAVDLIERLLAGERVTHDGRFYRMVDALCEPRPVQARLPILIGGSGREKTLRTTARHADLWNGYGEPARIAETSAVLRERCEEIGRPFESIERTVTMDVVIRNDEAAARAAFDEVAEVHGIRGRIDAAGAERGVNAAGPPRLVADYLRKLEAIGIAEVMWIFRAPFDAETIRRLPEVRAALATSRGRDRHRCMSRGPRKRGQRPVPERR
jgi:F420-dependent oxidoreductase-like protein